MYLILELCSETSASFCPLNIQPTACLKTASDYTPPATCLTPINECSIYCILVYYGYVKMSTVTPVRNSTARRRNIIWFSDFVISTVKSQRTEADKCLNQ